MPEREGSRKRPGPEVDQRRRKLLQAGLGLAGAALTLDIMAAAKPAALAFEAATNLRDRGASDSQLAAKEAAQKGSQTEPFHLTDPRAQTTARTDGTLAQQGISVPKIGDISPEDGLRWLEQHWQGVLEVGIPAGTALTIVAIVRNRFAANSAMESSFQHALTLLENTETDAKADAATELLYLLSDPRSEKYHQRIFAAAVDHFRHRNVADADRRETAADFKFVPVLVFAASALRDRLERKGANAGDARGASLDASHIHLDGLSLREADLSYLDLKHATFTGTVLSSADVSHADLTGADLSGAALNGTNLSHTALVGTRLTGARARNANLHHALLWNTNLENADLSYTNLGEAELRGGANFAGANIYRAVGLTAEMRNTCLAMGAIERDWG